MADQLTGNPSAGQADILTGNPDGKNLYILGVTTDNGPVVFYDASNPNSPGSGEYALIPNYVFSDDPNTQDKILLAGDPSLYSLGASPDGLPSGTGIFYNQSQNGSELIGIVGNVSADSSQLNLNNPNEFVYL